MRQPSKAEKKAIEVLDHAGVRELPVPVKAIADSLGAEIAYEAYEGEVSGMLYRSDDAPPLIGVNSSHGGNRQRFTIAHEIGHLTLHKGTAVYVDSFARVNRRDNTRTREEAEANAFAAELLMPRLFVAREVDQALNKESDISPNRLAAKLAKRFRVSAEAMTYRLENLDLVDPVSLTG